MFEGSIKSTILGTVIDLAMLTIEKYLHFPNIKHTKIFSCYKEGDENIKSHNSLTFDPLQLPLYHCQFRETSSTLNVSTYPWSFTLQLTVYLFPFPSFPCNFLCFNRVRTLKNLHLTYCLGSIWHCWLFLPPLNGSNKFHNPGMFHLPTLSSVECATSTES